jgi:hypothetical protein
LVSINAPPKPHRGSRPWTLDWATLLQRTYDIDALRCPCGGRLRIVELLSTPKVARARLKELGLDATIPIVARARAPTAEDADFDVGRASEEGLDELPLDDLDASPDPSAAE